MNRSCSQIHWENSSDGTCISPFFGRGVSHSGAVRVSPRSHRSHLAMQGSSYTACGDPSPTRNQIARVRRANQFLRLFRWWPRTTKFKLPRWIDLGSIPRDLRLVFAYRQRLPIPRWPSTHSVYPHLRSQSITSVRQANGRKEQCHTYFGDGLSVHLVASGTQYDRSSLPRQSSRSA